MPIQVTPLMRRTAQLLADSSSPLAGRRIAEALGISPTTAISTLRALEAVGAVSSTPDGRSIVWEQTLDSASILDPSQGAIQRATRTVLVATALNLEFVAVRSRMVNARSLRSKSGVSYVEGILSGEKVQWRVVLALFGMGNSSAAAHFSQAISEFHPDLTAFVGVAAGLKPDDDSIGDVVVGLRAYNAVAGKDTVGDHGESLRLARPASFQITNRLEQLANEVILDSHWNPATPRAKGSAKARTGAIASVESVQADISSQQMQMIRRSINEAIALDMESFGAYQGAHLHNVPAISLRGLSDFVSEKGAKSDSRNQPLSAENAAAFLSDLLYRADPGDVPPLNLEAGPTPTPTLKEDPELGLPPHAQPWERRLRAVSRPAADAAVSDLAGLGSDGRPTMATWLARALHRQPAWLRSDSTGDAWALVASLAEAVGAPRAFEAWANAARLAQSTGEPAMAVIHRVRSITARLNGGESDPAALSIELQDDEPAEWLGYVSFYAAAAASDEIEMQIHAPRLLQQLTVDPNELDLPSAEPAEGPFHIDDDVRAQVATAVLVSLGRMWLIKEEPARAAAAARAALRQLPTSTAAALTVAQSRMAELLDGMMSGEGPNTGAELTAIEEAALVVRDRRALWNGPTAEALALAGRAHAQSGDPVGALRMLREPPFGTASAVEAKDPNVVRVTALAALLAGDSRLAIDIAKSLPNDPEAQMMQANALSQMPGMTPETQAAYLRALEMSESDAGISTRALFGLAQIEEFDLTHNELAMSRLDALRQLDRQRVELILATDDLHAARFESALRRTREFRGTVLATEIMADALVHVGKQEEAVRALDEVGRERGDNNLRMRALMLAGRADLMDLGNTIADSLIAQGDDRIRLRALIAKLHLARGSADWSTMAASAEVVLSEQAQQGASEETTVETRWLLVEALYHRGHYRSAWETLAAEPALPFSSRSQVLLLFAIIRAFGAAGEKVPPLLMDAALLVAPAWVDDEQVTAEAVKVVLLSQVEGEVSEHQISQARALQDTYFDRYSETSDLRRINVEEGNMDELFSLLKEQFEPSQAARQGLAQKVWSGEFPYAVLAEANSRTYSEVLIKRAVGCYVLTGEDSKIREGQFASAVAALGAEVVVDTSALVVGPKLGGSDAALLALFDRVLLPSSLRRDIESGRSSLAMKSTASLGWNSQMNQPTMVEFDEATVEEWAQDAAGLYGLLPRLSVVDDSSETDATMWTAAALLAKKVGKPLWADDVALRHVARELGVPAFGTLDVLAAARSKGIDSTPDESDVTIAMAAIRGVEVDMGKPWSELAARESWNAAGYTALLISRPRAWADALEALKEFQQLIKSLPAQRSPGEVAAWTAAACRGLGAAVPPAGRPKAVGALLAWTALNVEPMFDPRKIVTKDFDSHGVTASFLQELLRMGESLQTYYDDAGSVLAEVIGVISGALLSSFDTAAASRFIVAALSSLDEDLRSRAMTAFLSSPKGSAVGVM
jgi:nucleoside phosphorylase